LYQDPVTLSAIRRLTTLKTYLLEKDPQHITEIN
jgi:hypothetical protein